MAAKQDDGRRIISENRKARHEYFITDSYEAGIELKGTEVKSLRTGQANIAESYASFEDDGSFRLLGRMDRMVKHQGRLVDLGAVGRIVGQQVAAGELFGDARRQADGRPGNDGEGPHAIG